MAKFGEGRGREEGSELRGWTAVEHSWVGVTVGRHL